MFIIISKKGSIHDELFEPPCRRCDVTLACRHRRPSCVLYADAPSERTEGLVKWSAGKKTLHEISAGLQSNALLDAD